MIIMHVFLCLWEVGCETWDVRREARDARSETRDARRETRAISRSVSPHAAFPWVVTHGWDSATVTRF